MGLSRILIFSTEKEAVRELTNKLTQKGYSCRIITSQNELSDNITIDLFIVDKTNGLNKLRFEEMIKGTKQDWSTKILTLMDKDSLSGVGIIPEIDDFILKPIDYSELYLRIQRLLKSHRPKDVSSEYLTAGDMAIDVPRCEVSIAGKIIDLTYTEYELLKLLVSKKGQVLTREVLLNKIWGYDYFGGDRTVDVHITRLRSKIDDANHYFIETVRNIGYRVKIQKE